MLILASVVVTFCENREKKLYFGQTGDSHHQLIMLNRSLLQNRKCANVVKHFNQDGHKLSVFGIEFLCG